MIAENGILTRRGENYSHETAELVSYDNEVSELDASNVQQAIDLINNIVSQAIHILDLHSFTILTTDWELNEDEATQTDYPFIAIIESSFYTDESAPFWQLSGIEEITTLSDKQEIQKVQDAYFYNTGIVLYATELPEVDLILQVKGD